MIGKDLKNSKNAVPQATKHFRSDTCIFTGCGNPAGFPVCPSGTIPASHFSWMPSLRGLESSRCEACRAASSLIRLWVSGCFRATESCLPLKRFGMSLGSEFRGCFVRSLAQRFISFNLYFVLLSQNSNFTACSSILQGWQEDQSGDDGRLDLPNGHKGCRQQRGL